MEPAPGRKASQERACIEKELAQKNPFAVLSFLAWDHPWNGNMYGQRRDIERAADLMREAGVGFVRVDFYWQDIEPARGDFRFGRYDAIVDTLRSRGINVLGILHYSADWASSCGAWNCAPRDNADFTSYATAVMTRYKGKVGYWEVWNEPDSRIYWEPQDGLQRYVTLLKDVYIAAKRVDPGIKILNGGLAGGLAAVNRLYDAGAGGYFDIMNIHVFEAPVHKGAIHAVCAYARLTHRVMTRKGDGDKKIWITEIGCPGVPFGTTKSAKLKNWWAGRNPSEKDQALWVRSVYTEVLKDPHVERVFWAFFQDTRNHWNDGTDYFGLVRKDFSRKPAFFSFRKLHRAWRAQTRAQARRQWKQSCVRR